MTPNNFTSFIQTILELKRKPLELTTSLVISIVVLLQSFPFKSTYTFPDYHDIPISMDPLRLAAQIVLDRIRDL